MSEQLKELFGDISDSGSGTPPEPTPAERPKPEPPNKQPIGTPGAKARPAPRVGTSIQRSDAVNRRKAVLLATPPPPPPSGRRRPPTTRPKATRRPAHSPASRPSTMVRCAAIAATDPAPTPGTPSTSSAGTSATAEVIRIQVAPGTTLTVPHHAAYRVRRFRAWTPEGKWILRFDRRGRLRSSVLRPRSNTPTASTAPRRGVM